MATRSGTTYKKRQKELARQDKQREKAARRAERKLNKQSGLPEIEPFETEDGNPLDDPIARGPEGAQGFPG